MTALVLAKKQIYEENRSYRIAVVVTHNARNLTRIKKCLAKQGFELYQDNREAPNGAYFCAFQIPDTRICRTLIKYYYKLAKARTERHWPTMTKAFIKRREANRRTARHGHPRKSPASGYIAGSFTDESSLIGGYSERLAKIKGDFIDKHIAGDEQRWVEIREENLRAYRAAKEGKLL